MLPEKVFLLLEGADPTFILFFLFSFSKFLLALLLQQSLKNNFDRMMTSVVIQKTMGIGGGRCLMVLMVVLMVLMFIGGSSTSSAPGDQGRGSRENS